MKTWSSLLHGSICLAFAGAGTPGLQISSPGRVGFWPGPSVSLLLIFQPYFFSLVSSAALAWGPQLWTLQRVLLCPNSVLLVPSLTSTLPSLPLPGPIPPWVCLAQGRLSEEIEKLRQEVDQLKGRGGPFVDGIHSRY